MILGVTGTRYGMTTPQRYALAALLASLKPLELHHGDCKGADEEAAQEASCCDPRPRIIAHPGVEKDNVWRAYSPHSDETLPGKGFFARNRDIVNVCNSLIVIPQFPSEATRGGTWHTCRYARKAQKVIYVIWPDGVIEMEGINGKKTHS